MKRLITILLFLPSLSHGQTIGGTIIVAVIGSDGIIICADSRTAMRDNKFNKIVAYWDNTQKIFPIGKNYVIGFSGSASHNGIMMSEIINDFNVLNKDYTSTTNVKHSFLFYYNSRFPETDLRKQNVIMVIGYDNGTPSISALDMHGTDGTMHSGCIVSDALAGSYFENCKSKLSCDELMKIIPPDIYKYVKEKHMRNLIGGSLCFIKIDKRTNSMSFVNDYTTQQRTYYELTDEIKNGKIKVHYLDKKFTQKDLLNALSKP